MPRTKHLHLPLAELIDALAVRDFYASTDMYFRLRRYAAALVQRAEPPDLDSMRWELSALLCRTAEEQEKFGEIFEEFSRPFRNEKFAAPSIPLAVTEVSIPPSPLTDIPSPAVEEKPSILPAPPRKTSGRSGPLRIELTFSSDGPHDDLRVWHTAEVDQAVRVLREKEWTAMQDWDIAASIQRTIRAGGIPLLEKRRRKKAPQYLLLIDQKSPRDHLASLYADLTVELRRRDMDAEFLYYDFRPYRCWRDPRDPHTFTTIENLQSEFAGYKLLIVGEADGLLDLPDLRPSNLALDLFDNWREVALLCPKSTADWGEAELSLCPLFPVVPANAAGLAALVQQWEGTEIFTPRYWQVLSPEPALPVATSDNEYAEALEKTIEKLYYYLGDHGFQWLCAAALYPEMYWQLTKLLHNETIPPEAQLDQWEQNRLWQTALLRLSRVHWFRQGAIPTPVRVFLREYFESQLPPEKRRAIRDELLRILGLKENQPPPDSYAAADHAFTIAWYEYERAIAAPKLSDAERARIEAEFREKGLAKIQLAEIEDVIGRKIYQEVQERAIWPPVPEEPGFHILWVDDEPKNNKNFQKSLSQELEIRFTNVRSTEEALSVLTERGFHLIISDIGRVKEGRAGIKMMQAFQEKQIKTPILFVTTANNVKRYRNELIKSGAAEVLADRKLERNFIENAIRLQQQSDPASTNLSPENTTFTQSQQQSTRPKEPGFQVLWVDDEPKNNARFQDELNELMHAIFTNVRSTEVALTTLAERSFDLIVSDVSRHRRNDEGANMLRAFREQRILTPVIFYTTPGMVDRYENELRELGAAGVFASHELVREFMRERVMEKQGQNEPASNASPENISQSQSQRQSYTPPPDARIAAAQAAQKTGEDAMEAKNYEAAAAAYQQALDLFTELKDDTGRANTHQALGKLYVETGNLEDALQHFKSASTLYLLLNFNPAYAYALMDIGGVQRQMDALGDAQKSYEEALEILEDLGDAENIEEVRSQLSLILHDLGKSAEKTIFPVAPVFLLAFGYDQSQALSEVINELKTIQRLLSQTGGNAEPIWQATPADLEERFDIQRDNLRLFHYSGHASPNRLQLNRDGQASRIAFSNVTAQQVGLVKDLRLVFLNGCTTHDQAQAFLKHGAAVVIATTKPLIDQYAIEFARRFYQSFTRRNSRYTLRQAFETAFDSFTEEHGYLTQAMLDEQVRGSIELDEETNEPLYELHLHPQKGAEVAGQRFISWFETAAPSTGVMPSPSMTSSDGSSSSLRSNIQDLVSQGRLEEALTELAKVFPDAILLKGQYASAKRENKMGLLDDGDDWQQTVARITSAVLEMARKL